MEVNINKENQVHGLCMATRIKEDKVEKEVVHEFARHQKTLTKIKNSESSPRSNSDSLKMFHTKCYFLTQMC